MSKKEILSIDELKNVVGGKDPNNEEIACFYDVTNQYLKLKEHYHSQGLYEEWDKIEEEFYVALAKWGNAVYNAPESKGSILLSDYFNIDKYR